MHDSSLYYEIVSLIKTKREDDYWDFKVEHHRDKAALLHDILCMANSLNSRDCYIILGVDDSSGEVIGVEDSLPRRNQQNIIDFLREKKFAGDYRPKIEMHTFRMQKHEVDVIVILNTMDTPYYLREDYCDNSTGRKVVKANTIYTRVGDTNTPISGAADYSHVEYLWKKRLGLHLSPFERLYWLLETKKQWEQGEENHYNTQHPEFTLAFEDSERGCNEFYSYAMMNPSTSYGIIQANYFGTTLYSRQIIHLDSGRFMTVIPDWDFIYLDKYHHESLPVRYYIEDDISYILHLYLWNQESGEECSARNSFLEIIPVFRSASEKTDFFDYVYSALDAIVSEIDQESKTSIRRIRGETEQAASVLAKEMATGTVLTRRLSEFRNQVGGSQNG